MNMCQKAAQTSILRLYGTLLIEKKPPNLYSEAVEEGKKKSQRRQIYLLVFNRKEQVV